MAVYRTQQGDSWDIIAKRLFGSEMYMGALIEANFEYRKIVIFSSGVVLNVPEIDTNKVKITDDLPIWKRGKSL